ncbi:unnamed protein product, partial [Vitis vinifera]|uniref:Uncharacterized protein n=1 Tax=Vitis vinifera TaxID=29760 RepID=D7TV33_VITVI
MSKDSIKMPNNSFWLDVDSVNLSHRRNVTIIDRHQPIPCGTSTPPSNI